MSLKEVETFLHDKHVNYKTVVHAPAFSSQRIAEAAHMPARRLAKVTMVWVDDALAMAVLPASEFVDVDKLRAVAGARNVELATEQDFAHRFPNCEVGAMPPFGNLWGMKVFVSDGFDPRGDVAFEAGSHQELLEMPFAKFKALVEPIEGHFAL
jgi:Ala-tRNA(Pro) deacylase